MSTESQIQANRRNALNSTGPRTAEGKSRSSANSTKHGLSGAFRVLDNEDQQEFDELIAEYHRTFKPTTTHERFLVEEMVQARWRLARARRLEAELIEDLVVRRGSVDADAMMVAAFRNDTASAITGLQRYVSSIERTAFRALDQLLALRKLEAQATRHAARQNEPNSTAIVSKTVAPGPPNDLSPAICSCREPIHDSTAAKTTPHRPDNLTSLSISWIKPAPECVLPA